MTLFFPHSTTERSSGMGRSLVVLAGLVIVFASCSSLNNSPKYQLSDDDYDFRQSGRKYQRVFAYVEDDTMHIFKSINDLTPVLSDPAKDYFFLKRSFDVDIMTVGFKYRPGTVRLPRQLTNDFNGNVFVGYRLDRFKVSYFRTPATNKIKYKHRAITGGGFFGLGASSITPWTTGNRTTDEYNGLILSRGAAVMVGLSTLTVGAGIGWDYLTDRDKNIWIYQNKPWYGLTIGLNLN
jgi:hypothetical protein